MPPFNIVFAGTPEFAAISLQALLTTQHTISLVYTQPDRPAGRGQHLQTSPVKKLALQHRLTIRQPGSLRDPAEQMVIQTCKPDVMIVVAYGLLLPAAVLNLPRLGCINVHASLLPRWRGAAPIQRTLLAGDQETGISIMQMDTGLDTGPLLHQAACTINPTDTSEILHDRLAALGAETLLTTLTLLEKKGLTPCVQNDQHATYAAKFTKHDAELDWQKSAIELDRVVRAFNSWPVAFTYLHEHLLRVWEAQPITMTTTEQAGTILQISKHGIDVATNNGVLRLLKIQFSGGKPLAVADMINAKPAWLQVGQCFAAK